LVWLALTAAACGTAPPPPLAEAKPATAPTPEKRADLKAAMAGWLASPDKAFDPGKEGLKLLAKIYAEGATEALWVDGSLRPTGAADQALAILHDASAEGLDPADYRAEGLWALRMKIEAASPPSARDAAAFDLSLSLSLIRYLRHFHRGRVNPLDIGFRLTLPPDEHDYAAMVREAAQPGRAEEIIAAIAPPLVQYRLLRAMLPKYRALALTEGTTLPPLGPAPRKSIKPGDPADGLDTLRTRLIALGDLAATAAPVSVPPVYQGDMVEGVRRFQDRHGFEADGVVGRATWAALSVPISWRVHQIELAMERMRWLPHLGERPFVAVNVPMFRLWAWDRVPESGEPNFDMGVIVGKALNTRTPVFVEEMKYLIFRPYWNVPGSIVRNEILPILRRDPGYLEKQDMEIVDGQGDDAKLMEPRRENIERLAEGKLRLRQRPGAKNALGQVKFMFPNDENVYLHSTPAKALFGRARRDFSHGCVRVEDPVKLAEWALRDQPSWTRERILAAMEGTPSFRVNLTNPIRVVIYYVTAAVIPGDNRLHFAEDIYDHDGRLDRALHARRR
jgi:murein L,D-transpeptidase YcbB/YkuD